MTTIHHGWTEHHWVWQDTAHAEGVRVTSYLCECGKTRKVVTVLKKRVKKQPDAPPKPPRKPQNRLSRPRHSKPANRGKNAPESKCGRKTRIKPVSSKRSAENRKYLKLRREFLLEHQNCQICHNEWSSQVHHRVGREGEWLLKTEWWMALCPLCHERVETNRAWAMEQGYLKLRLTKDQLNQTTP